MDYLPLAMAVGLLYPAILFFLFTEMIMCKEIQEYDKLNDWN